MRITATLSALTGALGLNCCDQTAGPQDPPTTPPSGWVCATKDSARVSHLGRMTCPADWDSLKGPPVTAAHGRATSVKIIQELSSGRVWFPSSNRYPLHWDFARIALGYPADRYQTTWNNNYSETPSRQYALATVTHYEGPDLWVLQLFAGDNLSGARLSALFHTVSDSTWFGQKLVYLPANDSAQARAIRSGVPCVGVNQVFGGETFQSLNAGVAFGTLVRASHDTVAQGRFSPHDIVLTDGLPNDLPTVAGVVTTEFQTPLSHINVLSRNRGTPNMALRTAWTDSVFAALVGKSVRLEVTLLGWKLREASTSEVDSFWKARVLPPPPSLPLDTTPGIVPLSELGHSMLPRVGAKAANFGELASLAASSHGAWKVPEGGFAIPVAAYLDHIRRNGLGQAIDSVLSDARLLDDATLRRAALTSLQARIVSAPVDPNLLASIRSAILANGQYTRMRFRSSTNAEDLAEFNGAGLYSSFTGDLSNPKKPVEDALRKVWASLWNERAFLERSAYHIDQHRVAMGVLVHRGFPDEGANGVALTSNIYQPDYFGYVINAQQGEISVVNPPAGTLSEQWIYYPFPDGELGEPSLELISRSTANGGAPVLLDPEAIRLGKTLATIQMRFCTILGCKISNIYQYGMDVEFKFDGPNRDLYIKQARPLP